MSMALARRGREAGRASAPATPADLEETRAGVEALDRRVVAAKADIRDVKELREAVNAGGSELGGPHTVRGDAGGGALNPGPRAQDAQPRAGHFEPPAETTPHG